MLITGCQSHETSADYSPTGKAADAYGALSHTLTSALRDLRAANEGGGVPHRHAPATLIKALNALHHTQRLRSLFYSTGTKTHCCIYRCQPWLMYALICVPSVSQPETLSRPHDRRQLCFCAQFSSHLSHQNLTIGLLNFTTMYSSRLSACAQGACAESEGDVASWRFPAEPLLGV